MTVRDYEYVYSFNIDEHRTQIAKYDTNTIEALIKSMKVDIWGIHRRNEDFAVMMDECLSGEGDAWVYKTVDNRVRCLQNEILMRKAQLKWLYISLGLLITNVDGRYEYDTRTNE